METINTTKETKEEFEKERMITIGNQAKAINQDKFLEMLIVNWRTK